MVFVFTDGALTTEKKQVSTIHSKGGVEYGVSKKVAGNHSNMIVNSNRTVYGSVCSHHRYLQDLQNRT